MGRSKINREIVEALQAQIVEAALVERHPVDIVSRSQVGLVTEASDVAELEELITSMQPEHGIRPCRQVLGLVPGIAETVRKTVYYRPAERLLQEALGDFHPIVLVTTVETQRYVAALTRFCNEPARRRQLWIWRGTAGPAQPCTKRWADYGPVVRNGSGGRRSVELGGKRPAAKLRISNEHRSCIKTMNREHRGVCYAASCESGMAANGWRHRYKRRGRVEQESKQELAAATLKERQ
ncbi:hypothetical protein [uncultured Enterovirga sp.]|uniref:hypothetical protein n=1 Tax=uncultured Enterovirga sp. TaxID=2026352 RepID=UPI0035C9B083